METSRTLLIVDNEAETLKGYKEFLSPAKPSTARKSSRNKASDVNQNKNDEFKLLLAQNGEEAVQLVKAEMSTGKRVAAGFFDVKLGAGMDGLQTIQAVRALDNDIHCVVVTAYHDRTVDEIEGLFGQEFSNQWDYLNKPFTHGEIVQKARQMIAAWNYKKEIEFMHKELIRSERLAAVGQVARGVGHEFGNILLRIMGKADLSLTETDPAKIQENLKVILSASERAGVIVRNLQSMARTSKIGEMQPMSISIPLEEALSLVSHELVKASLKLEKSYTETPEVKIDKGGIGQVFLNLLINAIHATPKGGILKVVLEINQSPTGEKGVCCRVQDSGTGITPEVLPHIFEYAFTTKGDKGSGIGLAISKEIIESHGGRLSVVTTLGKGSEFSIWLPVLNS